MMTIALALEKFWYSQKKPIWPFYMLLHMLSFLYEKAVQIRRFAYQVGWLKSYTFQVPVVVVGNITVGGTGKTPLVIHIAHLLQSRGFKPGIISRGYKGSAKKPTIVTKDSDPSIVGDEPIVMANHVQCPIVVCKERTKAIQFLLEHYDITHVVSDDGLQHYAMNRTLEIAVVNGEGPAETGHVVKGSAVKGSAVKGPAETRRFGNELCLPFGPLREPKSRLNSVDLIITSGQPTAFEYDMRALPKEIISVGAHSKENNAVCNVGAEEKHSLESFKGKTVHAVAGIAHPERFFKMLEEYGINVIPHRYPDHYKYSDLAREICFDTPKLPVFMTEKDWVKCKKLLKENHDTLKNHFVLKMKLQVNPLFDAKVLLLLDEKSRAFANNRIEEQMYG